MAALMITTPHLPLAEVPSFEQRHSHGAEVSTGDTSVLDNWLPAFWNRLRRRSRHALEKCAIPARRTGCSSIVDDGISKEWQEPVRPRNPRVGLPDPWRKVRKNGVDLFPFVCVQGNSVQLPNLSPSIAIEQFDSNFYPAAKESATSGRACARRAQVSQRQVGAGLRILAEIIEPDTKEGGCVSGGNTRVKDPQNPR
jgi:hypothetical protein